VRHGRAHGMVAGPLVTGHRNGEQLHMVSSDSKSIQLVSIDRNFDVYMINATCVTHRHAYLVWSESTGPWAWLYFPVACGHGPRYPLKIFIHNNGCIPYANHKNRWDANLVWPRIMWPLDHLSPGNQAASQKEPLGHLIVSTVPQFPFYRKNTTVFLLQSATQASRGVWIRSMSVFFKKKCISFDPYYLSQIWIYLDTKFTRYIHMSEVIWTEGSSIFNRLIIK
jgi:hypothetical protein